MGGFLLPKVTGLTHARKNEWLQWLHGYTLQYQYKFSLIFICLFNTH